jgi:sugar phosphate isomerase/epimerase
MVDESKLAIHQVTFRDQWSFRECVEGLARHGVHQTAVWRDKLHEVGVEEGAKILRDNAMRVTGLSVGGLATSPDPVEWQAAVDENRRVLEEAALIGADHVVTISGGLVRDSTDLDGARARTLEALERMLRDARGSGVKIGIEPLHPMMCANRAVLCTLEQANDWCDILGDEESVGIVVDTYSVWWDPNMKREIDAAGSRICAFHVNDWLRDTRDLRLDRGMPGDGVIDIRAIRRAVEGAGYQGACEVEIFSARNWWRRDPDEVVRIIKDRFRECV